MTYDSIMKDFTKVVERLEKFTKVVERLEKYAKEQKAYIAQLSSSTQALTESREKAMEESSKASAIARKIIEDYDLRKSHGSS